MKLEIPTSVGRWPANISRWEGLRMKYTLTLEGVVSKVEPVRFVCGRLFDFVDVKVVLSEQVLEYGRSLLKEYGWKWYSGQPITIPDKKVNVNVGKDSRLPQVGQNVKINLHYTPGPKEKEDTSFGREQTMDDDAIRVTLSF